MRRTPLIVVLVLLGLAGCGGSDDPDIVVVTRDTAPRMVECRPSATSGFDAREMLGLSLDQANRAAKAEGCSVRVTAGDTISDDDAFTAEGLPSRIDVETRRGVVTAILPKF